jgi:class 3 adenylate cyclase
VNKFIGDGILAVFSDDDEGSTPGDHATRGVRCAYEMVTAPSRFSTGSGLHSGTVVVGNIGSKDKMEYTVLGDTVNLASRLESLNKERHTKLLMSGATQELLNGAMETSLLGSFEVRGKSQPVSLYTATSLLPEPVPEPAGKNRTRTQAIWRLHVEVRCTKSMKRVKPSSASHQCLIIQE